MHIETATLHRDELASAVDAARLIALNADVLAVLSRGPATAREVADDVGMYPGSALAKLSKLNAAGVVSFIAVPSCGRFGKRYIYSLTDRGADLWRATQRLVSNAPRRSS